MIRGRPTNTHTPKMRLVLMTHYEGGLAWYSATRLIVSFDHKAEFHCRTPADPLLNKSSTTPDPGKLFDSLQSKSSVQATAERASIQQYHKYSGLESGKDMSRIFRE